MRLLEAAFERRDATFTLKDPGVQILRDVFGIGNTAAGISVTESRVEGIPVVWACIGVISDAIAHMPIKVMRRIDRGKEPDTNHALYSILHDLPNPMMTAHEFKATMQRALCAWGNAYALIDRYPSGDVKALWPLLPERMKVEVNSENRLVYEYREGQSQAVERWTWDSRRPPILHLRCNERDGIHGRSPITVLREAFADALAAQQYSASFWANSAIPAGLLLFPNKLKAAAKQNIRESWNARFQGTTKAAGTAILEEGAKFERLTIPPEDAQFIETRRYHVEDLARVFRVPPFLVNLTERTTSWGTGLAQQSQAFIAFTMLPWMNLWTQAIARDLLTYKSFETHEAVFVVNALVKGDLDGRTSAYEREIKIGMLNPNEARELEDMNPREGGDEYVDVQAVNQGGLAPSVKSPTPEPEPEPDEEDLARDAKLAELEREVDALRMRPAVVVENQPPAVTVQAPEPVASRREFERDEKGLVKAFTDTPVRI